MDKTFCDGIGSVSVGDNVVRMDFISLSAIEKNAEGQSLPVFRRRIIMPIQGFLKLYGHLEQTYNQMQRAGLIADEDAQPTATDGTNTPKESGLVIKPEVTSPNF